MKLGRKKETESSQVSDTAADDNAAPTETAQVSERETEFARISGLTSEVERLDALAAFHAKYPAG